MSSALMDITEVPTVVEADILGDCSATPEDLQNVHVVLVGDSTLDNVRYLNFEQGELSVEKQLTRRCAERGWDVTLLAQDGSMLEDVLLRQLPRIPDQATHIVLSASGNDLLSLLNEMVVANFTAVSMYRAIVQGLAEVSQRYRDLMKALKSMGCHLACCTVYQPHFNHLFFKSLAAFGLGLHNNRLKQISTDLDASVIDLANMFDSKEDFANPLELSTRGGAKLVENVSNFVSEHPPASMIRYRRRAGLGVVATEGDEDTWSGGALGVPLRCCATREPRRRIYCCKEYSAKSLERDVQFADAPMSRPLKFSEDQQNWREGRERK